MLHSVAIQQQVSTSCNKRCNEFLVDLAQVAAGPLMEDASEKDANLDVERQDVSTDDIDEDSDPECQEYDCSNEDEDNSDLFELICILFPQWGTCP